MSNENTSQNTNEQELEKFEFDDEFEQKIVYLQTFLDTFAQNEFAR